MACRWCPQLTPLSTSAAQQGAIARNLEVLIKAISRAFTLPAHCKLQRAQPHPTSGHDRTTPRPPHLLLQYILKHRNRSFQTFRILKNIRSCAAFLAGPSKAYFCLYTFTERANPCSGTVRADLHLERSTSFLLEELEKFSAHWTCAGGLWKLLCFEDQDNHLADLLSRARSLISKPSRSPNYVVNHYVVNHSPCLHNQKPLPPSSPNKDFAPCSRPSPHFDPLISISPTIFKSTDLQLRPGRTLLSLLSCLVTNS